MAAERFEIETPEGRKRAMRHFLWVDHAILRYKWTNFDEIAKGVYRSNHPGHERLEAFKSLGGNTVLSLRGAPKLPSYMFEEESCEVLGLELVAVGLSARKAPRREALLQLLDLFETIDRPFLMHCKSGADRTGLASVLYLMIYEGRSLESLKDQLSFKYIHIRKSKTGILDHFFRLYAEHNAKIETPIQDWIANEYDPDVLTQSFNAYQKALKPWEGWR